MIGPSLYFLLHTRSRLCQQCFGTLREGIVMPNHWSFYAPKSLYQSRDIDRPVAACQPIAAGLAYLNTLHNKCLVVLEKLNLLHIADRYNEIRQQQGLFCVSNSAAVYLTQQRRLHDREVSGPTATAVF